MPGRPTQFIVSEFIGLYLQRAYQAPLLSQEEETALAIRIEAGGRDGERARNELVTAHLKMVPPVVRKNLGYGVPFEDLLQEGNIGLLTAADKFERAKGVRFATYAWWWVRNAIKEHGCDNRSAVRIPASKRKVFSALTRSLAILRKTGEPPTDERLSRMMKISIAEVRELAEYALFAVSMHTKVGDGDIEFGDLLEDTSIVDPTDAIIAEEARAVLRQSLNALTERERIIVSGRHPLDDEDKLTLEDLAQQFGISRERVRQIEVKAMGKLAQLQELKDLL